LNLENHASTWGFHSRCLKTYLHWNNGISINDLMTEVIVLTTWMFVNLKLYSLNDIIFLKIIKHVIVKAKQTYIKMSSFHWASYLRVNESRCEGTPPRYYYIALDEPASWVDVCALGACYWLTPNDSWLLASLLEKLVAIPIFFKKKLAASLLYRRLPKIFKLINTLNICLKPVEFIQFLLTI